MALPDKVSENPIIVQKRVIWALILRETRVAFGGAQLGYFWAVANPVIGVSVLSIIFSSINPTPPIGTSYALFIATGYIGYEMYQKYAKSMMNVFDQNRGLFAYPLVTELDAVFARYTLILLTYFMIYFVFFICLILLGWATFPIHLGQVIAAILALSLLGLGMGMCNAVIKGLWKTWTQIEAVISRPLFFLSGVFFIPTNFPSYIRDLLAWNPILHGIEWFREGYYVNYDSVILDKGYLSAWIGILLVLGFGGERLYRKRLT